MARPQSTWFDLPDFSLSLNFTPEDFSLFPNALEYTELHGRVNRLNTQRDILMMQVMNAITDKQGWDRKVFDEEISSKWRNEITSSGKDVTPTMMDWIFKELQWKANIFGETGQVVAYDAGVVKSDTQISVELQQALKDAVHPLEDVAEDHKDYHPGSENKVLDLVHPSLFPLIYGRTRVLPDETITLDSCLGSVGQGKLLPVRTMSGNMGGGRNKWDYHLVFNPYSCKFQWLPCDIEFTDDNGCRIKSYINNLHPKENRRLYEVTEKILARVIPLWDTTLTNVQVRCTRILYTTVEYFDHPDPKPEYPNTEDERSIDDYDEQYEQWERSRPIKRPEPDEFEPCEDYPKVNLRQDFAESGLQVIVKLANIELTPENPEYGGGSWHVEGQLNERICATAIYYYDSENITESTLSFRQRASTRSIGNVKYPQDRHEFVHEIFGIKPSQDDTQVTQNLGSVSTQEGRLLAFPNILQHRVSPFSLADKSKPGHRKILAFFLVDPNMRIVSTANVPPQREDWWKEKKQVVAQVLRRLPLELQAMVTQDLDATPITMNEAKRYRLELMEERKGESQKRNDSFETGHFNLCEH